MCMMIMRRPKASAVQRDIKGVVCPFFSFDARMAMTRLSDFC